MPAADCRGATCLAFAGNAVGDAITFTVEVPRAGTYRVGAAVKTWRSRGTYHLAVRDRPAAFVDAGSDVDLYAAQAAFPDVWFGSFTFTPSGTKDLRLTSVGRNAASSGHTLGLDVLLLDLTAPLPTRTLTPPRHRHPPRPPASPTPASS